MALRKLNSLRWKILTPIILSLWLFIIGMGWWQIERESDYRTEIVDSQLRLINSRIAAQINSSRPDILNDFFDFIDDYYRQDSLFSAIRINIFNSDWEIVDAVGEPMRLSMAERRGLQDNATIVAAEMLNLNGKPYFCNAMRNPENGFMIISALPDDGYLEQYLSKGRTEVLVIMAILAVVLTIAAYYSSRFYGRNITLLRDFARRSAVDPEFTPGQDFPHDELGDIARQIVSLHTERQHAMAQMRKEHDVAMNAIEEKSLQKRQLTNNINHELKSPIGVIKGYLETLNTMDDLDDATRRHFIRKALDHANRLVDLIADVSVMTRLEEGAQLISTECLDYHELVYKFSHDVNESGVLGHMEFTFDVPMNVRVRGNVNLLTGMLMNLAKNAANYSAGTTCSLEYLGQVGGEFHRFAFYDDGIGVPDESLEHIFERFYRVDIGRSRKAGGTGLGLSIVYNTVNAFGGTIEASNRPEMGFQVTFTLPICTNR